VGGIITEHNESCVYFIIEFYEPPMQIDRITVNPKQMNGQPCVRNMRLTVKRVVELLAVYPNRSQLFQEFPELEKEDIRQALIFASSL
jgi:uncharacterized protein (DUF433 family)